MSTSGTNVDQIVRYVGFQVGISGVSEAAPGVDANWESSSGGAVCIEMVEGTVGNDGERRFTPGKKYVTDLTLVGFMTPGRQALLKWLNNSARGQGDLRADVSVQPLTLDRSPTPQHIYENCMIKTVTIPRLSAGSSEQLREVVCIKSERYRQQ